MDFSLLGPMQSVFLFVPSLILCGYSFSSREN
jgi:hypothetical protein